MRPMVGYDLAQLKRTWCGPNPTGKGGEGDERGAPALTHLLAWLVQQHPEEEELLARVSAALATGCGSLAATGNGLTHHAGGRLLLQETCYGEGESLAFQTWSSATCFTTHFPPERIRALLERTGKAPPYTALELGCGTGLAGLYCAALLTAPVSPTSPAEGADASTGSGGVLKHVFLTDRCPTAERLARANIARNGLEGRASFAHLDWRWVLEEEVARRPLPWPRHSMDLLLACDAVYEEEGGGRCLPPIVEALLAPGGAFVLLLPLRPNFQRELALFDAGIARLVDQGLQLEEEEERVLGEEGQQLDHRIRVYRRRRAA